MSLLEVEEGELEGLSVRISPVQTCHTMSHVYLFQLEARL